MSFAPIALFAFNRPDLLKRTLETLKACSEAGETPLHIFVDGARNEAEKAKVSEVVRVAGEAEGFASVEVTASPVNKGLGQSIIDGVSEVINRFGRAIVMEDDLSVMPNFLAFMNDGLERYASEAKVFSVCGYTLDIGRTEDYPFDTWFGRRSSSWGWATWKDRWDSVDWNPSEKAILETRRAFNRWGGSDCSKMLLDWRHGANKSWAIRFCYAVFRQGKLSLFPVRSLVDPDAGFNGEGTNCKPYNRFRFVPDDGSRRVFRHPESIKEETTFVRRTLRYHSIPKRIWSRIMYKVKR